MHDNIASVREEARKKGGDELVAKVDAAIAMETEFAKMLDERIAQVLATEGEDARLYSIVGCVEALSNAFARTAVEYGKANKTDDSQIMVLSIRSIVNSIQTALDDREAKDSDVLSMIRNAAKGDDK